MKKLLVIIPDALSALVTKGEITDRYYNPGDIFDEVHILMINNDTPDPTKVKPMVGRAKLFLHNHPIPPGRFFHKTLGWRPLLMRSWAKAAVTLAKEISPALIRCHGNHLNAFIASEIKRKLKIPYVVSLHTHPGDNRKKWGWWPNWKQRLWAEFSRTFEYVGLKHANRIAVVYSSLLMYTDDLGLKDVEVIHNVVSPNFIADKTDYAITGKKARILSVSRQFAHKDPGNIIRAVASIDFPLKMTIIGDGPIHGQCRQLADSLGLTDRIEFIPSMSNDKLCKSLPDYDLFVVNRKTYGIPKAVIEPLLSGLPVIVNDWQVDKVDELNGNWVYLVEDTPEGYSNAINRLLGDDNDRAALGERARQYAALNFYPPAVEQQYASLYNSLITN